MKTVLLYSDMTTMIMIHSFISPSPLQIQLPEPTIEDEGLSLLPGYMVEST